MNKNPPFNRSHSSNSKIVSAVAMVRTGRKKRIDVVQWISFYIVPLRHGFLVILIWLMSCTVITRSYMLLRDIDSIIWVSKQMAE